MDRNTAVWVLILVIAVGMTLAAVSSSSSLNREVGSHRRDQESQAVAIAAPPPAPTTPAAASPEASPPPPAKEPPPAPKKKEPPPDETGSDVPEERLPKLAGVAKRLVLSPELRDQVGTIANRTKKEIFDLLWVPRVDGGSMASDILRARAAGDLEVERGLLARLPAFHLPGTQITYGEAARLARAQALGALFEALGGTAFARFRELNLQPDEIDTGFDPWTAHEKAAAPRR